MAKMTLKLPKAAVSMQEGKIVEWFVANGADVAVGQKLYALETEKTTIEDAAFELLEAIRARIAVHRPL